MRPVDPKSAKYPNINKSCSRRRNVRDTAQRESDRETDRETDRDRDRQTDREWM